MGDFEAIVIGGGHAGVEAALALARLGTKTVLITQNPDTIARMSCNPAIGGLSKGNLVREIDALGGQMGILADAAAIQMRMLNRSRGAAVRRQGASRQGPLCKTSPTNSRGPAKSNDFRIRLWTLFYLKYPSAHRRVVTERGALSGLGCGSDHRHFYEAKLFIGAWSGPGGRLGEPAALGWERRFAQRAFL